MQRISNGLGTETEEAEIGFEFRSLDRLLRTSRRGWFQRYPRFEQSKTLMPGMEGSAFLPEAHSTAEYERRFRAMCGRAKGVPLGRVHLKNVVLVGPNGLLLDRECGACWLGFSAGWPVAMAEDALTEAGFQRHPDGRWVAEKDTLHDQIQQAERNQIEHAVLISGPGGAIYGHWLVDIAHRLRLIRQEQYARGTIGIEAKAGPIAQGLLDRALPDGFETMQLQEGSMIKVRNLIIDTIPRHDQILDAELAKASWQFLEEVAAPAPAEQGGKRRRIFVSRAGLPGRRKLANAEELEAYFAEQGWDVIRPETLSFPEQIALFRQAGIIVGEDGSGLHNCIFSPPGTKLIVINSRRVNYFHASIAAIRGQHIAYIQAQAGGCPDGTKGFWMDPKQLGQLAQSVNRD